MEDYIIGATAAGATIRAFAAITTNMVEEARNMHVFLRTGEVEINKGEISIFIILAR